MAARGNIPPFDGRSVQAPGMMRHGSFPGSGSASGHRSLEASRLLENKIASQEAEIEQLVGDNRRLASTHVALREELINAQQEVQKLRAHIRSIQTESDIQIRVLLDKIAKMEADIRASEGRKKELKLAHMEAQSLAASRQELKGQIEQVTKELKKAHNDVQSMPDLQAELDRLVQERQRLRATFEFEKKKNIELVEHMKASEKNLIAMAREVEMLRAEIQNVEKRIHAPNMYGAANAMPGTYADAYGTAHDPMAPDQVGETPIAYGSSSNGVVAGNIAASGNAVWTGPSAARK